MPDQLRLDWLDALLVLRRMLDTPSDVRELIDRCELDWHLTSHRLVKVELDVPFNDSITLHINDVLYDVPKIERVEGLLYAAAGVWYNLHYPGNVFEGATREAFQFLCQRAGCHWSNSATLRERWRLIDFKTPAHLLPIAVFETRERCKVCASPVATGAEAVSRWHRDVSTGQMTIEPRDDVVVDQVITRADLHEECARYVHRVMIPARLEQLAAAAKELAK